MTASISVTQTGDGDPLAFEAVIVEGKTRTRHEVTMAREDQRRLAPGAGAEVLIEAAFRFLLDREPKEAILTRFDVSVISRYFPDFETRLPDYLR